MAENDVHEQVALFRYGVIADFINLPPGTKGLYALIKKKAGQRYAIPGSRRTKVAEETIRSWLKKYRKGGFDALQPKTQKEKLRDGLDRYGCSFSPCWRKKICRVWQRSTGPCGAISRANITVHRTGSWDRPRLTVGQDLHSGSGIPSPVSILMTSFFLKQNVRSRKTALSV